MLAVALALALSSPGVDTLPRAITEFRSEHSALLGSMSALFRKAVNPAATRVDRANLVLFLRSDLAAHARAEELVLYPALEQALGTKGVATATMVLDHQAITRYVDELGALAGQLDGEAYRQRACAVAALIENHFAKEEAFVLPQLRAKLSEIELLGVFARMGEAIVLP